MRTALLIVSFLLAGCTSYGSNSASDAREGSLSYDETASGSPSALHEGAATTSTRAETAPASDAVVQGGGPGAGTLTAGDVDDHLNWADYLRYVARMTGGQERTDLPRLDFDDRVTIHLVDERGAPMSLAPVVIRDEDSDAAVHLVAGSDGLVRLFPRADGLGAPSRIVVESGGRSAVLDLGSLDATREADLTLATQSGGLPRALDLMFVVDTTGSMGDELTYLTAELRSIVADIAAREGDVDIRVGLIVYKDEGDDYVVKRFGFADGAGQAAIWMSDQEAGGGGDYPEAMDEALARAVDDQWRDGQTARLLFLVADAPPHPEGYDAFMDAAFRAREAGIRIYPVAASGVADDAEYLMRAAAVQTQARYLFLTDDSGVGNAHAEPRIPCYVVTHLNDLIVRVVRSELTGERVEPLESDIVREVGEQDDGVCLS